MAIINSGRIPVSGSVVWDVLAPSASTSALQINKVEIANKHGSALEIGWGEELPIITGKYESSTFTPWNISTQGNIVLTAGQNLAVLAPKKFDVISVTLTVNSSGASTMGVYNGTNLTSVTLTATYGSVSLAAGSVNTVVAPTNSWVAGGISGYAGMFAMVTGNAAGATISRVRVGRIIDFVSEVDDLRHAIREYAIEPLQIYKGQDLFAFFSASQTTAIATIDYSEV